MLEPFDAFIAAVAAETHIPFKKQKDGVYLANIEFEGGRHQKVTVALKKDESGDSIIEYTSLIAEIQEKQCDLYQIALETNMNLTYGALAIDNGNLVIKQVSFFKDRDPQRFMKSLSYVAARADEMEEDLTLKDIQ